MCMTEVDVMGMVEKAGGRGQSELGKVLKGDYAVRALGTLLMPRELPSTLAWLSEKAGARAPAVTSCRRCHCENVRSSCVDRMSCERLALAIVEWTRGIVRCVASAEETW